MSHNAVVTVLVSSYYSTVLNLNIGYVLRVGYRRRITAVDKDDLRGVTWVYGRHDKNSPEVRAMLTAHALVQS